MTDRPHLKQVHAQHRSQRTRRKLPVAQKPSPGETVSDAGRIQNGIRRTSGKSPGSKDGQLQRLRRHPIFRGTRPLWFHRWFVQIAYVCVLHRKDKRLQLVLARSLLPSFFSIDYCSALPFPMCLSASLSGVHRLEHGTRRCGDSSQAVERHRIL